MRSGGFILIGFGNFPLIQLVRGMDTHPEVAQFLLLAPTKLPPKYKKETMCSLEEVEAAVKYAAWLKETVSSYEEN